jgi:hypothetical protein|tara:strand:+ start:3041 stop:3211 length:171 start_codon:yes stop_codon:yes gene_type:complete
MKKAPAVRPRLFLFDENVPESPINGESWMYARATRSCVELIDELNAVDSDQQGQLK